MAKVIHLVAWKINSDANEQAFRDVDNRVITFRKEITGLLVSYAGPFAFFSLPEELAQTYKIPTDVGWLARGYNHGLNIVFADENSRRQYDIAPPHLDFANYLIPLLEGGNGEGS